MQKTAEIKCAQLISIEIDNEIIQGKQKEMLSMRLFLREPKPLIGHHNLNPAADLAASERRAGDAAQAARGAAAPAERRASHVTRWGGRLQLRGQRFVAFSLTSRHIPKCAVGPPAEAAQPAHPRRGARGSRPRSYRRSRRSRSRTACCPWAASRL